MRKTSTIAASVLVLSGFAVPALAQGAGSEKRWQGLHISATFGPTPTTFKIGVTNEAAQNVSGVFVPHRGIIVVPGTSVAIPAASLARASFTAGARAGYDWQSGLWVYGIEGGVGFGLGSTSTTTFLNLPPTALSSVELVGATKTPSANFAWSIGGRVGRVWHEMLLYGSGGLAGASVTLKGADTWFEPAGQAAADPVDYPFGTSFLGPLGPNVGTASESHTLLGWSVGVGLERSLTSSVSAGFEYRYTRSRAGTFVMNNPATSVEGPTPPGFNPTTGIITGFAFPSQTAVGLSDHRITVKVTVLTPWFRPTSHSPAHAPAAITGPRWQGIHASGSFGVASEQLNFGASTETIDMVTGISEPFRGLVINPPFTQAIPAAPRSPFAAVGGVRAGYDRQSGVWVFGAEGGLEFGLRSRSVTVVMPIPGQDLLPYADDAHSARATLNRVASPGSVWSATARVGREWNRFLLFGTVGVAGTSVTLKVTDTFSSPGGNALIASQPCPLVPAPGGGSTLACATGFVMTPNIDLGPLGPYVATVSESHRYMGLVFGVGAERPINGMLSVGIEYRHTGLGTQTYNLANPAIAINGPVASGPLFQGASALALPGAMTMGVSDNRLSVRVVYKVGARK